MQVKKEEKRERIIKEAIQLFAEYGFQEVSVSNIAKKVSIGKGTIYTYFKTKDEILEASVAYIFDSFVVNMENAAKNSSSMDIFLDKLVDLFFMDMSTRSRIFFLFQRRYYNRKSKYKKFTKGYRNSINKIYNNFSEDIKCTFEEIEFFITSFMMTSYMMKDNIAENRLKATIKSALKKLILK